MDVEEIEAKGKKDIYTEHNSKIINSISPFSTFYYEKKKKIDVFVGRDDYLRILSETLFKSVFSDQSFGINISGPGGCGKSTLFGYFTQLINSQKLFHENYCKLNKDECVIITCFIDAPKGEPTTLKYFWTSIIDALAEPNIDFLERFAIKLFIKFLDVLWISNFKREELSSLLVIIVPNFEESVRRHNITELIDVNKLFSAFTQEENFSSKIYNLISSGWRTLQRHEVTFGILGKTGDFSQKRAFKFDKRYFDLLFDTVSNDINKSTKAQNIFKGVEGNLIKSDSEVINLFNWLTQTWEWIEEKPISFLIGVDNIGYLTVNIQDRTSAYIPFIQTLLQMRNSLKKFLYVLIGTSEDWRLFNDYTKAHQDYRSQLQGFIVNNIDLTRLTLSEVLQALSLIINKFWGSAGIIDPSNPLYPFSKDFFSYLYEYYAHDYRKILQFLDRIWSSYKSKTKVVPLVDPFFMIKFVRIIMRELSAPQIEKNSLSSDEIYFSNLIDWEKETIRNWFETLISRHIGQTQSELVENGITESIRMLQEREIPKQIDWVEHIPSITITLESGKKTRFPDIYIKLMLQSLTDKKRAFEIQVKMYDRSQFVKLKDIESSIELLESAHTDALLFIMTGAGLEESAIEYIKKLNLADRVLYSKPLNDEQLKALTFLIAYEKITGNKPSIPIIKEILEFLFEQPWDSLLDRIKSVGSFTETRIIKEIEIKKKGTLEPFIISPPSQKITSFLEPQGPLISPKLAETDISGIQKSSEIELGKLEPKIEIKTELQKELKIKEEKDELSLIVEKLKLEPLKATLKNNYNRYKNNLKEIKFIIECAETRTERYKGKTTKEYLKKNVPPELSDEVVSELFLRLKNEDSKNQLPKDELIFSYQGTSLAITKIGKDFYKVLNEMD